MLGLEREYSLERVLAYSYSDVVAHFHVLQKLSVVETPALLLILFYLTSIVNFTIFDHKLNIQLSQHILSWND